MKNVIIKIGSSSLQKNHTRGFLVEVVRQIAYLKNQGLRIILVSSGAVATGKEFLTSNKGNSISLRKVCASIGQVKIMQVWSELFALFEVQVAQLLLSKDNFSNAGRCNTKSILLSLIQHQVIPIINENDPAVTDESKIGDNDSLAALVANLIQADTIVLLTDQEGVFTADPRIDPKAKLISHIDDLGEQIYEYASGSGSALGTGGMITKIEAAKRAAETGTQTIIASSFRPNVLIDLLEGKKIGTRFYFHTKEGRNL